MNDIYKLAGDLFNAYWQEFKKTVPEDEMRCARFWCNHGFLSGFIGGKEDRLVKNYLLSCKYYTDAREEGVKQRHWVNIFKSILLIRKKGFKTLDIREKLCKKNLNR